MKRNGIIAAAALLVAGASAYFIRKKIVSKRNQPVEPSSGDVGLGNGRRTTKHRTEAFSRAKNAGGKPAGEKDII